jgi:hypothetical protein
MLLHHRRGAGMDADYLAFAFGRLAQAIGH